MCTLNKLPNVNTASVLIVGDQGTMKHDLAKAMVETRTTYSLQVRTATRLPLSEENAARRPRIDLVVFLMDLTSRKSIAVLEESLRNIDVRFFLGKCCFVAIRGEDWEAQNVAMETATQLADSYHCQILTANLEDESSRQIVARQILQMASLSAGFHPYVSSLLVDSTKTPYQTESL